MDEKNIFNENLINDLFGINETKIAVLDAIIKLAKKSNGIVTLEDLEKIKNGVLSQMIKKSVIDNLK